MKKIFLNLSLCFIAIAPLTSLIACSSKTKEKPMVFSDPKNIWSLNDGGIKLDHSYNQQSYEAIVEITKSKTNYIDTPEVSTTSVRQSYDSIFKHNPETIVVVSATQESILKSVAPIHQNVAFLYVDAQLDEAIQKDFPNVTSIIYKAEQSSFIAGYQAAKYASNLPTPRVSTFGGKPIDSVLAMMYGFKAGVDYWNSIHTPSEQVELFGSDANSDSFVHNFYPNESGFVSAKTESLIKEGVDVIFPVGGPQEFTVTNTILTLQQEGKIETAETAKVIGVDSDFKSQINDFQEKKIVLGSVLKNIKSSIVDVLSNLYSLNNDNKLPFIQEHGKDMLGKIYSGDLQNQWVSYIGDDFDDTQLQNQQLIEQATRLNIDDDLNSGYFK